VVILAVEDKSKRPLIHMRGPTQKVREDSLVRVHQCANERSPLLCSLGAAIEETCIVEDIHNCRSPCSSSGRDSGELLDDVQSCLVEVNCWPVTFGKSDMKTEVD